MKAKSLYRSSAGSHFYGKEIVKKTHEMRAPQIFLDPIKNPKTIGQHLNYFHFKAAKSKTKGKLAFTLMWCDTD